MSNYSSRTIKRLMSEIKNIEKNREEMESCGLYIYYDESNIGEFYFMIIGTEDTPYEKGFYPFKLVIPSPERRPVYLGVKTAPLRRTQVPFFTSEPISMTFS